MRSTASILWLAAQSGRYFTIGRRPRSPFPAFILLPVGRSHEIAAALSGPILVPSDQFTRALREPLKDVNCYSQLLKNGSAPASSQGRNRIASVGRRGELHSQAEISVAGQKRSGRRGQAS